MILKNKNILITGAGKGIGFETVKMLINEGAFVYALIKSKQDYKKFRKVNKKNIKFFFGRVENLSTISKIFKD